MAEIISLDFEGKTVGLTMTSLLKSTIARFFHVHEDGLHLKVSRNGKIENVWPSSNGKFFLPPGTMMLLSSPSVLKNIKTTEILCPLHLALGKFKLMY